MAFVAWITPLDTLGAAIVLNAAVAAAVVVVGNRLLRTVVTRPRDWSWPAPSCSRSDPSTIGLGHVLMTDMAFALVTMIWMLTLIRFRRTGSLPVLIGAALLAWVGFGLRYVGLVLIAFGGLWLLFDRGAGAWRPGSRNGVLYGRRRRGASRSRGCCATTRIDGTYTGERNPSARGLVDNGFDVAATLGRFLLPGWATA